MTRKKYKSLILPISFIVLSLVIIVSSTLAYFVDKQSSDSPVSFGKVEITAGEVETLSTPLRDVIAGSKITDKITFSKAVDSESMYVRAKVYFSTDSTVPAVKDLVSELNGYDLGALGESSAYGWSDAYNNIHYLVSKTDTSKAYALTNNDVITLSNGFSIPTELKQSANLAQYMQKVSFNIEIQAIQSASIDAELKNVDVYFVNIFGDKGVAPFPMGKFTDVEGTAGYTDNENLVGKYYIEMGSYPQSVYVKTGGFYLLTVVVGETYTLEDGDGNEAECPVYTDGVSKYVQYTDADDVVTYYKIEPVRWVVIGQADGSALPAGFNIANTSLDKLLVVSEKVLTQKQFDSSNSRNDFANAPLNIFMNGALLNDLFTAEEQARIQDTNYTTTYANESGEAVSLNSHSKLFPLAVGTQEGVDYDDSYVVDLLNDNEEVSLDTATSRATYASLLAKPTALAMMLGATANDSGYCMWWLRSGYDCDAKGVAFVEANGGVCQSTMLSGNATEASGVMGKSNSSKISNSGSITNEGGVSVGGTGVTVGGGGAVITPGEGGSVVTPGGGITPGGGGAIVTPGGGALVANINAVGVRPAFVIAL